MYESQVIPKGIKTNYFAPTKIHIHYKTIKIYNNKKNHQKLLIINITFKHNHQNQLSKTIIIDNKKLNQKQSSKKIKTQ